MHHGKIKPGILRLDYQSPIAALPSDSFLSTGYKSFEFRFVSNWEREEKKNHLKQETRPHPVAEHNFGHTKKYLSSLNQLKPIQFKWVTIAFRLKFNRR